VKSINFNGIKINAITYGGMFSLLDDWLKDKGGKSHHIACINAYCVALSIKNKELANIYNNADIVGPDGMPFVKWIRHFHKLPCDRIAAPDIILEIAKNRRYNFYLYGGDTDVLNKTKEWLETKFPFIKIIGQHSPPFRTLTKEEDEAIIKEINSLNPDIICVALGTPKQDFWIKEHLPKIKGAVFIAAGATFDFFGGRIKLAPDFIRNSGFEWLYRLFTKDFHRLWKRYTYYNFIFIYNFVLQLLRLRFNVDRQINSKKQ
jgi:N-acetylglucosaminyldiphosphoundecaprenol N-acetyl-beta-D-mannosaminyltransferase